MKRWFAYILSFGITAIAIGGTLYFFMKTPVTDIPLPEYETVDDAVSQTSIKKKTDSIEPGQDEAEYAKQYHQALQLGDEGRYEEARNILKNMIQTAPHLSFVSRVQQLLWDINVKLLLSPDLESDWVKYYEIKRGDSVYVIAKKFGTTIDLILEINDIKDGKIYPKQKLKIIPGTFSILIDKSLNQLTLSLDNEVIKVYSVGTGKDNNTPTGDFKIVNKIKEPTWHTKGKVIPYGNPDNLLGTRWMGFDIKGYGIHGTWDKDSIGKQSSDGCVRLRNEEVEELFKIVPVGTSTTVVD
ncbi:MAG: L,D-transpeptidase family protein [Chlamydiota bacterium]|nr:L,D-transpeptidase family protein [Chlamydiota bacterium]